MLDKLREMSPASILALKELTYKLMMLIALVSAQSQRGQTIHLLDIKNMTKTESSYSFTITELTKPRNPGIRQILLLLWRSHVHQTSAYASIIAWKSISNKRKSLDPTMDNYLSQL